MGYFYLSKVFKSNLSSKDKMVKVIVCALGVKDIEYEVDLSVDATVLDLIKILYECECECRIIYSAINIKKNDGSICSINSTHFNQSLNEYITRNCIICYAPGMNGSYYSIKNLIFYADNNIDAASFWGQPEPINMGEIGIYPSDCTLDDLNNPSRLIFVRYPGGGLQCFRLSSYIECLNNSKNVDPITNITVKGHDFEIICNYSEYQGPHYLELS